MKKLIIAAAVIAFSANIACAQVYKTRTGKAHFNATNKNSPETIEAKNNEVGAMIDSKTGDVRFQVLIKSFKFERALMQEHFNENYMESDKFPKSEFKGAISNLSEVNFAKDGTYNAQVSGKLTIHGVTKDVSVPGAIVVKGNSIELKAKFSVTLKDYGINVPAVVSDKVDKVAVISIDGVLNKG